MDTSGVKRLYLFVAILLFLYILYRAASVGVTYDEVWTINSFVPSQWINILCYIPCDANNHLLNTFLIKLFFLSGNHSLFVARLPNVLAAILYLSFAGRICFLYLNRFTGISCYLVLTLNPFLLDFFSLARGYGLSLAFMISSLFYLITFVEKRLYSAAILSLLLASISVLASFSILNFWISLLFILLFLAFCFRNKNSSGKFLPAAILISSILVALVYGPIRKLKQSGSLYYGGDSGFYKDTLTSLSNYTLYSPEADFTSMLVLNSFLVLLVLSVAAGFRYDRNLLSAKNILILLTVLCICSVVGQHYLLGTLYLIDRTALFFYPLFVLVVFSSLNRVRSFFYHKIIMLVLTLASLINFFKNANLSKTAIWYFDAQTVPVLNFLNKKGEQSGRKVRLDYSWPFAMSIGYYLEGNSYPYIESVKKDWWEECNEEADYYFFMQQSLEKVGYKAERQQIATFNKDTILQFQKEHLYLFTNIKK